MNTLIKLEDKVKYAGEVWIVRTVRNQQGSEGAYLTLCRGSHTQWFVEAARVVKVG